MFQVLLYMRAKIGKEHHNDQFKYAKLQAYSVQIVWPARTTLVVH